LVQPATRVYILLFLTLVSFYSITDPLFHMSGDGPSRYSVLKSFIEEGEITRQSKFPVGENIVMAPFFLAGRALQPFFEKTDVAFEFCLSFYQYLAPLSVVVLLHFCRTLGVGFGNALVVALLFGLATSLWPYAHQSQSEPLAALSFMLSLFWLFRFRQSEGPWHLVAAGLAAALTMLTRYEAALYCLPLGGYLIYVCIEKYQLSRKSVWMVSLFAAVSALGPAGILGWNYLRFGEFFQTGYGQEYFSTPLLYGLHGMLFSSGKSVFLYCPVYLLSVFAWRQFYRERREEALTCLAIIVIALCVYSKFWAWGGDASWGPRFLVVVMPFCILPMGWFRWSPRPRLQQLAIASLLLFALWVQVLGISRAPREDYRYKLDPRLAAAERAVGEIDEDSLQHFMPELSPLYQRWRDWQGTRTNLRFFPYQSGRQSRSAGIV